MPHAHAVITIGGRTLAAREIDSIHRAYGRKDSRFMILYTNGDTEVVDSMLEPLRDGAAIHAKLADGAGCATVSK